MTDRAPRARRAPAAWLAAGLLAPHQACSPEGGGAAGVTPSSSTWRLVGEHAIGAPRPASHPSFAGALDLLGADCTTAAVRLGAAPPPCRVELWRRQDGTAPDALFLVVGSASELDVEGRAILRPTRWTRLGPTLGDCLGDPLDLPPAQDPAGFRGLVVTAGEPRWMLSFSGANRCALSGWILLSAADEGVDVERLEVDGLPWRAGGVERARERLRFWVREQLQRQIQVLGPEERIVGFEALVHDPDPAAGAILEGVAAGGGPGALDAAAALERRARRTPEPP